jgi:hypothetical protein
MLNIVLDLLSFGQVPKQARFKMNALYHHLPVYMIFFKEVINLYIEDIVIYTTREEGKAIKP